MEGKGSDSDERFAIAAPRGGKLEWQPSLDASHIGVVVHGGIVTLTGNAPSYGEKRTVGHIAQQVRGVEAIANEIKVRMPGGPSATDSEIARDVVNALGAAIADARDRMKIAVSKGWVYLEGDLDSDAEKTDAESAVTLAAGRAGVIDQIAVLSRSSALA